MTIEAVFFDMGGTIETYHHDSALRLRATPDLRRLLQNGGIDLDLSTEELRDVVTEGVARYRAHSVPSLIELPTERIWKDYVLQGYPVNAQRLAAIAEELTAFVETRYYLRVMRPEMPRVLEAIRAMGLRMGVISNVMSRGQVPQNLEAYGIRHFFDPIVLSSVYGRRKPDPSIFRHAARQVGVGADECAHVGDRLDRDIEGARRTGYRLAIQIRHHFDGGIPDTGATPDALLDCMGELPGILEDELRQSSARSEGSPNMRDDSATPRPPGDDG
jgi:putative hydrolase of the HAD superfamily